MGLVHIYCGDGKGKTTCSVGLAVRFASTGQKVLFYQFMKNQKSGERSVLETIPEIEVCRGYEMPKFSFAMNEEEKKEAKSVYESEFEKIKKLSDSGKYGMIILDEIMSCISCGFLDSSAVADFIRDKENNPEIVMTGRDPAPELCELADYISEIQKIKHPYDRGITARRGVEV